MLKKYYWQLIIFFIALLLRFVLLDKVPIGITADELNYVLNAKAIILGGSDISGTWSPFSLTAPPFEVPKGEIPYLLIAPFIGAADFSLFAARFPYALASSLFPVIIFLIVSNLIGKKEAIIAGLIMAINPWSIFFGRTAYDTPLTVFFYFVAFYILLVTKKWKILLSFPFFFIAFFGYVGTKLIFLPFVAISVFFVYKYMNKKRFIKQYLVLCVLCISIFSYFLLHVVSTTSTTRTGDLLTPNNSSIAKSVGTERQLSIDNPLNPVFINKFTAFTHNAFTHYINAFSPTMLFAYGEQSAFISLKNQGFFYFTDVVFLVMGFCLLFTKNRRVWVLLLALTVIAPLPSAASTVGLSYAIRSSLLIPIFIIYIAVGIAFVVSNKKYRYLTISALLLVYTLLLSYFLHNYFFRHPIYASDTFNLSGRLVAKYIDVAEKSGKKITIIVSDEYDRSLATTFFFTQYLFYTNNYNKDTYEDVANAIITKSTTYKNIKMVSCPHFTNTQDSIVIVESGACNNRMLPKNKLSIARLADGGEIYAVYDSLICRKYDLKRYPQGILLDDFIVEGMTEEQFCNTYITKLE